MDVFLAQIFQSFNIMIDVEIPIGGSCFDGIMYIDTFDSGDMKSSSGYFRFQRGDPFAAPYFSGGRVIQSGDDAGDSRNLSDLG